MRNLLSSKNWNIKYRNLHQLTIIITTVVIPANAGTKIYQNPDFITMPSSNGATDPTGVDGTIRQTGYSLTTATDSSQTKATIIPHTYETSCESYYPLPQRFSLHNIEKKGIGYKTGYVTLDAIFAPPYHSQCFLPMIDIRGHYFNNDTWAANLGIVGRYILPSCRILGANAYYDYREGNEGHYHQLGLGLEILSERLDFRFNGCIPFGGKKRGVKYVFDQYAGGYIASFYQKEWVLRGINAEVGSLIIKSRNFLFYAAAGPYYLSGKSIQNSWGGKIRLHPQFRDYVALELGLSNDRIFKTIFQVEISFTLPIYKFFSKKTNDSSCVSRRQIYQPVQRFEIIPLKSHEAWETNYH